MYIMNSRTTDGENQTDYNTIHYMVIVSTDKDIHNKEGFVIETELNEESLTITNKHLNES